MEKALKKKIKKFPWKNHIQPKLEKTLFKRYQNNTVLVWLPNFIKQILSSWGQSLPPLIGLLRYECKFFLWHVLSYY